MIDPRWTKDSNVYTCECGKETRRTFLLWRNQHGFSRRVFCHNPSCLQWTDVTYTERAGWSVRIAREAI
jgi:hypothetical protein